MIFVFLFELEIPLTGLLTFFSEHAFAHPVILLCFNEAAR